jgi:hypothetical protein
MNYVDSDYVIDELSNIHSKGFDIEVDWLSRRFSPAQMASPRIKKSIGYWGDSLKKHLLSHNVELEKLTSIKFVWPSEQRRYMFATDDRGKEYKIYVNEIK